MSKSTLPFDFNDGFSTDALAYGLDDFYFLQAGSPGRSLMLRRSPHPLPGPAEFSISDPMHVASMAMYGAILLPFNKADALRAIDEDGAFTRRVDARLTSLQRLIEARQDELLPFGYRVMFTPPSRGSKSEEEAPPGTVSRADFKLPAPPEVAQLLDEYERAEAYIESKPSGRMNRYAAEFLHSDIAKLLRFVEQVDAVAASWGFVDYRTLVQPDRFIARLLEAPTASDAHARALHSVSAHRDFFRTRPPIETALFARAMAGEFEDFSFEIPPEGLTLVYREGAEVRRELLADSYLDAFGVLRASGALRF
ncbi:MAG: hypothetical protein ACT6S0_00580 [Roseateles sp.]|uniref:Uncharacterized protein n=1 Tax=Roseateles asaccharophilus TaxID=582607 RepID=A0ABU2AGE1_9BURK|nr:hypothetical protein [Roseateles asaccharophilus]MDR7336272.1 hypothetical protein [Roseateles asaccharophilus]